MDNWYSLSYLYFSTIGTLVTLLVGMLISLPTGNYHNIFSIHVYKYKFPMFDLQLFTALYCDPLSDLN